MRRATSRWRFVPLALLLAGVVVELLSLGFYGVLTGELFRWNGVEEMRAQVRRQRLATPGRPAEDEAAALLSRYQVVHPYLGYVLEPSERGHVNEYGFQGAPPPFEPLPDDFDRVVVGVFGGSVAERMVHDAAQALRHQIGRSICFSGRPIEVVNLALPGEKQPQQLMSLAWLLSLGAHFDLVLTLDGFNEIVLPVVENGPQGTFPFYPRNWRYLVSGIQDVPLMRAVGEAVYWSKQRRETAVRFSEAPLRYSVTANLVWLLRDRALSQRVREQEHEVTRMQERIAERAGGYLARGPVRSYADDAARRSDLAATWRRATAQMHALARAHGIPSFHFLQPNQWLEGSKVFSADERAIALPPGHAYAAAARDGYPDLIAAGRTLAASGVPYHDLTMVFAEVEEPVYVDGCCHVNVRGSKRLAREIARVVRESLERSGACERETP